MAEKQQIMEQKLRHVSGKTVLLTSITGVIIGGPLLGLMGFSFVATMTLLLVTSPLLIIFSPVLFGAACVFALAMLGFTAAGAMAVAGVSAVAWVFRSFTSRTAVRFHSGGVAEKSIETGGDVEEDRGKDWAGYLQQRVVHINPSEKHTDQ